MADIGSSTTGFGARVPESNAQPVRGEMPRVPENASATTHRKKHGLWESLTASLEMACRGYLCMQVVDCDPVTDPECSAAGKKVVVREVPGSGLSTAGTATGSAAGMESENALPYAVLKEREDAQLSGK